MNFFIKLRYKTCYSAGINALYQAVYFVYRCDKILPKTRITYKRAIIPIARLSFDELLETDFTYHGIVFPAKISDGHFQKAINNGRCFAKGDRLKVHLTITQKWHKGHRCYINKSYEVSKVLQHITKKPVK